MLVRDLMQRNVVTLEANAHLDLAGGLMQLDRIRHLPVVERGRVVGIVSQRDLFRAGVSSVLEFSRPAEERWLARIPVRDVMSGEVVTIHPDATARSAVDLMIARAVGCLPVVERGALVGIVSESDMLRFLARLLETAEVRERLPDTPPCE